MHNLAAVALIASALRSRDSHEAKQNVQLVTLALKPFLASHCSCCGHKLSTWESMKLGVGPLCASGYCLCS